MVQTDLDGDKFSRVKFKEVTAHDIKSITIDVESELGLCLATTLFIEYCSESILPKEVDRLQLICFLGRNKNYAEQTLQLN